MARLTCLNPVSGCHRSRPEAGNELPLFAQNALIGRFSMPSLRSALAQRGGSLNRLSAVSLTLTHSACAHTLSTAGSLQHAPTMSGAWTTFLHGEHLSKQWQRHLGRSKPSIQGTPLTRSWLGMGPSWELRHPMLSAASLRCWTLLARDGHGCQQSTCPMTSGCGFWRRSRTNPCLTLLKGFGLSPLACPGGLARTAGAVGLLV